MKIIFVCPECGDVVIADYEEGKMELIEPCECVEEDLEGWFENLWENWDEVKDCMVKYEESLENIEKELMKDGCE